MGNEIYNHNKLRYRAVYEIPGRCEGKCAGKYQISSDPYQGLHHARVEERREATVPWDRDSLHF